MPSDFTSTRTGSATYTIVSPNGTRSPISKTGADLVRAAQRAMLTALGTRNYWPFSPGSESTNVIVGPDFSGQTPTGAQRRVLRVDGDLGPVTAAALAAHAELIDHRPDLAQSIRRETSGGRAGPETMTYVIQLTGGLSPGERVEFAPDTIYPRVDGSSRSGTELATTSQTKLASETVREPSPFVRSLRGVPWWAWAVGGVAVAGLGYGVYRYVRPAKREARTSATRKGSSRKKATRKTRTSRRRRAA